MAATAKSAWASIFHNGETIATEFKKNPFLILNLGPDSVQVRAPAGNGREAFLKYTHLGELWRFRDTVRDGIRGKTSAKKALTTTVNEVWKNGGLKPDHTNESQYWALVCIREKKEWALTPDVDYEAVEGAPRLVTHLLLERDRTIVARKKAAAIRKGPLRCEVCGFDFAEMYPGIGSGFCEVHHNHSLAGGQRITKLAELAILCSNCHRMIHRTKPMENVEAFRQRIKTAR